MPLTLKQIEAAIPKDKSYKLSDNGGLCLLITPSGGKLWRWRYRYKGTEKMMALGDFPGVSLKVVRELHFEARQKLVLGVDPMAERKAESEAKQEVYRSEQRESERALRRSRGHGGRGGLLVNLPVTPRRS